jgi:hypothetical protein
MVNNQATNENTQRLVKASARHLHIAPRKMRPVTNLLLGMNVNDAIVQLQHMPKKAAPILIKLLKSAVANAQNNFSLGLALHTINGIGSGKVIRKGDVQKEYAPLDLSNGEIFGTYNLSEATSLTGSISRGFKTSHQAESLIIMDNPMAVADTAFAVGVSQNF